MIIGGAIKVYFFIGEIRKDRARAVSNGYGNVDSLVNLSRNDNEIFCYKTFIEYCDFVITCKISLTML